MDTYINGLRLLHEFESICYNGCGNAVASQMSQSTSSYRSIIVTCGAVMGLGVISVSLWLLEGIRMQTARAAFCLVGGVAVSIFAAILSYSVTNPSKQTDTVLIIIWIIVFIALYAMVCAVAQRSLLIIRNHQKRQFYVQSIRIGMGIYTLFCIGYTSYRNSKQATRSTTDSVVYSTFYAFLIIPFDILVTLLNFTFLYFGFRYIVPNEMKTGVSSSRLAAMFNVAAFFAVMTETAFVLQFIVLMMERGSNWYSVHSGICCMCTILCEYCMDHGIFLKSYLDSAPKAPANVIPPNHPAYRSLSVEKKV